MTELHLKIFRFAMARKKSAGESGASFATAAITEFRIKVPCRLPHLTGLGNLR